MRFYSLVTAAFVAFLSNAATHGTELATTFTPAGESDTSIELCGFSNLGGCCNTGPQITFDVDFVFSKYHQSGGVQSIDAGSIIGNGDNVDFGFDLSPRFTLGAESCNGLGARVRYWFFDQTESTVDNTGFVSIDAYTFDMEIYKRVQLGKSTTLEGFGGIRWSEFNLDDDTGLDWRVDGAGLTTGFEISHQFRCNHRLYAGTRLGMVMGDAILADNGDLDDATGMAINNTSLQVELSAGYEGKTQLGRRMTLVYGGGAEVQNWSDAAVKADASDEAYLTDAGWVGLTFRLGAEY
ncbi:hypothetical protein [Aeoliella mucimassa]|uniref:Uncharacterized protein n=1 Tax=Aeoliella mucimassa TaxID=2527972 RepID=A0A518AJF0_9BACT|nr:hypothetical protein [Aeoliella mucimassa]QDU54852.1 hypothetical protein Pan181_10360 [Aeoliella mucimassa]